MIKTITFKKIGFGKHANDEIKIIEQYTESNDYEGTYIEINGELKKSSIATIDAIKQALDEETAEWILKHL